MNSKMNSAPLGLRINAAGLVLGAVAFAVGDLLRRAVEPAKADTTALTTAVGDHAGAWVAAGLLATAAALLLLPGVLAAGRTARGRGLVLTSIGSIVTAAGLLGSLLHTAGYYGMYGVYAKSDADAVAVQAIDKASESYPVFGVGIALFMVGMLLGPILLTIGLRRAARVPVWVPLCAVVFAVSSGVGGVPAGIVGLVAAVLTFAGVGTSLLRHGEPAVGATTAAREPVTATTR
jgi:hypothetical protein